MSRALTLITSITLMLGLLVTTGCTVVTQSRTVSPQMNNILLAEPEPISIRSQLWLERLTNILLRSDQISDIQRAEFLYQRGLLYDAVGLWGLAKADFDTAIQLKPDMAEVFNFLGIHYTQNQQFIQAYDAFDSTLDIDPQHEYAYLNRGIALHYGGRAGLAVSDFEVFYQKDTVDPFRAIWLFIAEREVDSVAAKARLAKLRRGLDKDRWEMNLVRFYLDEISENELKDRLMLNIKNNLQLTQRLCEAYFYLGKYHTAQGQIAEATNYFKLSLSTNVYQYVEHRYARLELELMRERTVEN